MSTNTAVYYDPFDVDINADPYPTFKRLRDEAPIYYNERGRVALDELLTRFPEWEVDYDNIKLAPTSTVRGWQAMPLVIR